MPTTQEGLILRQCPPPAARTATVTLHCSLLIVLPHGVVGCTCTFMQVIEIVRCEMPGTLDPLRSCTALIELDLSNNQITGTLSALRQCAGLTSLSLYSNQLRGTLEPLELCQSLTKIVLYGNQLTGTTRGPTRLKRSRDPCRLLRALFGCAHSSHRVAVWHTGTLDPLSECTALKDLLLHGNQLTGTLAPLKGCAASLSTVNLNNNQLSGSLEPLMACNALALLDLRYMEMHLAPSDEEVVQLTKLLGGNFQISSVSNKSAEELAELAQE